MITAPKKGENFARLFFVTSASIKNTLKAVAVCPDGKLCKLC